MNIENLFESKSFKTAVLIIGCLIILIFVFCLGVFVGTEKAEFSFGWAKAYHQNFGGPQEGFLGGMMGKNFTDANGVFGQIIKIDGNILTIQGKDNVEKNILVDDGAKIVCQRQNIKLSELKINDEVIVIGDPIENGQIQAELIRIMPIPPKNCPQLKP